MKGTGLKAVAPSCGQPQFSRLQDLFEMYSKLKVHIKSSKANSFRIFELKMANGLVMGACCGSPLANQGACLSRSPPICFSVSCFSAFYGGRDVSN